MKRQSLVRTVFLSALAGLAASSWSDIRGQCGYGPPAAHLLDAAFTGLPESEFFANPGQEDVDFDTEGDLCDPCPALPFVLLCPQTITAVCISFTNAAGKGSGTVSWRTGFEFDLLGFNVVTIDNQGDRIQQNLAPVRCEECVTGSGHVYTFIIPKHKSGHNIFVEMLRRNSLSATFGPAVKDCIP